MLSDSTTNTIIVIQHAVTSFIGIVGNVLVLIVYKKRLRDNETITFFIVHLALTDLACCLFLIPINCYHELNIGAMRSDFMCKFHSFLNIINITYSCLLMTLVAFERCFSIVYPFRRIVTKTRAKVAMSGLFIFCFGIAFTSCLGIGIYHRVHRVFAPADLLNSSAFMNYYDYPIYSSYSESNIRLSSNKSNGDKIINDGLQKRQAITEFGFIVNSTQ